MIEINALGPWRIKRLEGEGGLSIPLQPKQLAVLIHLLVDTSGGAKGRDALLALFWPAIDEPRARNALNQIVHHLRKALGPGIVLSQPPGGIAIQEGAVRCDVWDFERLLAASHREEALELYHGELLEGFHLDSLGFERWLELERARLRRCAVDAAAGLADESEREEDLGSAVRWLRRALELRPSHENHSRKLIELLALAGDRSGALAEYERIRQVLEDDYGLQPSGETRSLVAAIRAGRDGRADSRGSGSVPGAPSVSEPVRAIAVLPFRDLGGERDDFYFADGMTDALIVALGRSMSLRVISTPSALSFRDRKAPVAEIARELGVHALVDGAVLRVGDRVRITAHLIRADPEEHLWSEAFDRDLSDVLDLHAELAEGIASRIEAAVAPEKAPSRRRTVDAEAYEAYLRGRHYTRMWPDFARAVQHFQAACSIDPAFVEAFAGLALCYMNLAVYGMEEPSSVLPPLERAVTAALDLDPASSDAHVGLGGWVGFGRRDVVAFRKALQEALWEYATEKGYVVEEEAAP